MKFNWIKIFDLLNTIRNTFDGQLILSVCELHFIFYDNGRNRTSTHIQYLKLLQRVNGLPVDKYYQKRHREIILNIYSVFWNKCPRRTSSVFN